MVRINAVVMSIFLLFLVTLVQKRVLAQYINGNFRGNCPCRNVPIQRNWPINLPIRNSWPIRRLPATNNEISLPCPCNANPARVYNELPLSSRINAMTPEERIAMRNNLLSNLKVAASNLLPIAEKISILYNLISANRDPVGNPNMPVRKLNVPIVNKVPAGAIRIARNLPIANFEGNPIGRVANDVQVFGRGQVNYQNIGGFPLNNIARLPIDNFRNMPLRQLLNMPENAPNPIINARRFPFNNPEVTSYQTLANLPFSAAQRRSIINQMSLPNNIPNLPLKNIMDSLPITKRVGLPLTDLPNSNRVISVNIERPLNYNLPVDSMGRLRYNNLVSPSVVNSIQALASSRPGRVVAKVPVVPYNILAKLPAYNGLPVIKVAESVYRLTPVNNIVS